MDNFVSASEGYLEAVKTEILDSLFSMLDNIDAVSISIINKVTADINTRIDSSDAIILADYTRIGEGIYNIYNQAKNELDAYQKKVVDTLNADATDSELVAAAIKLDISDALDKYSVEIVDGVTTIIQKVVPPPDVIPPAVTPPPADTSVGLLDAVKAIPAALVGMGKAVSMFGRLADLTDLMHSPDKQITALQRVIERDPSQPLQDVDMSIIHAAGVVGGLVGAPLGFLPAIMDAYSAGPGQNIANAARYLWHPTRIDITALATAHIRGEITPDKFVRDARQLGYSEDDAYIYVRLARQMLPAADLVTLWKRGELSDSDLTTRLGELGVYPEQSLELVKLSRMMLTAGDLIPMWLRGELTESQLNIRLTELGVIPDDIAKLKKMSYFIPQVNDLIHMAVREAFTPAIAEKFGQYEDYPDALTEWGNKQGLSEEWAKRYWAAHWDLPSPQMGFEMLHRGVINQEELNLLLRALDIMPFWRGKITDISYTPYTRVDIRRMHKMNLLTRDEVVRAHMDIGYDADKAEKLTQFTIELNKEEVKLEKQAERDLTTSEITNAYANSAIGESEANAMLTDLGYDANEIELKLVLAELPVLKRIRDKKIAIINQRLLFGVIDLNGAVDALNALDMPANEMTFTLADWQLDLELQQLKQEAADAKQRATKKAKTSS